MSNQSLYLIELVKNGGAIERALFLKPLNLSFELFVLLGHCGELAAELRYLESHDHARFAQVVDLRVHLIPHLIYLSAYLRARGSIQPLLRRLLGASR